MSDEITFQITAGEHGRSATIFIGESHTVTEAHPAWEEITEILLGSDPAEHRERLLELLDIGTAVSRSFERVTDRVAIRNGHVFFDSEHVDNDVTEFILDAYRTRDDAHLLAMANFLEKVQENPNEHSRSNLFRWMRNRSFAIAPDGHVIGYKAVGSDRLSYTAGYGIVNGEEIENGHLPNEDGNIVEMPRDMVEFDPSVPCSNGLHVGTLDYARGFRRGNGVLVLVAVNPRDVVSVPTDANDAKMRVRRYEVIGDVDEFDITDEMFVNLGDFVSRETEFDDFDEGDEDLDREADDDEDYNAILIDRSGSMAGRDDVVREVVEDLLEDSPNATLVVFGHGWSAVAGSLDDALNFSPAGGTSVAQVAEEVRSLGARHFVVVTDADEDVIHNGFDAFSNANPDFEFFYGVEPVPDTTNFVVDAEDLDERLEAIGEEISNRKFTHPGESPASRAQFGTNAQAKIQGIIDKEFALRGQVSNAQTHDAHEARPLLDDVLRRAEALKDRVQTEFLNLDVEDKSTPRNVPGARPKHKKPWPWQPWKG